MPSALAPFSMKALTRWQRHALWTTQSPELRAISLYLLYSITATENTLRPTVAPSPLTSSPAKGGGSSVCYSAPSAWSQSTLQGSECVQTLCLCYHARSSYLCSAPFPAMLLGSAVGEGRSWNHSPGVGLVVPLCLPHTPGHLHGRWTASAPQNATFQNHVLQGIW
jgi:hypothetical protein